ncbi:MAG: helix-turn-helix transcriptional regulator [Candidatus Tectomicrobia bacterium]|uniref:Helix-turn-helix transcriptional regulator n=1 Tax=Tectimicrobiota bacterium TaxID=2528274 RepID=A0A932G1G0_UNCTE|nr:helix-turn-helix transcriptional regulator [Candidatus Tectomicrobia bacterium]
MDQLKPLAETLKVLSDPTRLRILEILHLRGETCVCELEAALGMTQSNISFHMSTLRRIGLVTRQKVGKWVFYRWDEAALKACLGQLTTLFAPERADTERSPDLVYVRCQREEISRAEILAEADAPSPDPA